MPRLDNSDFGSWIAVASMKLHRLAAAGTQPFHVKIAVVESPEFQRGIALFNHAKFFEAHEVLEDIWRPMDASDTDRICMQGIVQVAVALHHQSTGNRTGALSVMRRAARNLAPAKDKAFGVRMPLEEDRTWTRDRVVSLEEIAARMSEYKPLVEIEHGLLPRDEIFVGLAQANPSNPVLGVHSLHL